MRRSWLLLLAFLPVAAAHGTVGDEVHVVLRDGAPAFEPFEHTLAVGSPVAWTDETGFAHVVVSVVSPRDETPTGRFNVSVAPKTSSIVDVGPVGDVFYRCSVHDMIGVLHVVAPTPAASFGAAVAVVALTSAGARWRCRGRCPPPP